MFCSHIDLDNLEFKTPTNNRSGGKVVHVSTKPGSSEWKDRIRFQMSEDQKTNLQVAVWGLSTPLAGQDTTRRTLELSVESPELLQFLTKCDELNQKKALEMAPEWFKKSLNMEQIKNMYVPLLKPPVKEGSPYTVRVKVKTGEYPTKLYAVKDSNESTLNYTTGTVEDLSRNSKCLVMVETVGLWFMSRQFGMSLTATEILVWPARRNQGVDAFSFSPALSLKQVSEKKEEFMDVSMMEE